MQRITAEELRSDLDYDPETGHLTWKANRTGVSKGALAGKLEKNGYRRITVRRKVYLAHHLAWLHVTGHWPTKTIDHIDGDPDNNSFSNLRQATMSQQQQNRKRHSTNKSGFKGVSKTSDGYSWRAAIRTNGKTMHLGRFKTPQEAHKIYCAAAEKYFGKFARF